MLVPTPIAGPGWKYERASESAIALDALLRVHGLSIAAGSALESHILGAMRVVAAGERRQDEKDVRDDFRSLVGVHEIANLILSVKDHPSFPALLPHLELLNSGNALQMTKSHGADAATNKLFELFAATLAMHCGTAIEVDDPNYTDGKNPDVLFTAGGRRWGIACKVLHSTHPEGFLTHLKKGVAQIEDSPAECGIVMFNLKNVLRHDDIWPIVPLPEGSGTGLGAWPDPNMAFSFLFADMDEIGRRLSEQLTNAPHELDAIFKGRKSLPGFLLWGHCVSGVLLNQQPTPTSVRLLKAVRVGDIASSDARVLECLNWAAFHDSPVRGPRPQM